MFAIKIAHKSLADMEKEVNDNKVLAPVSNLPDPSFFHNSCTGKENESKVLKQRVEDGGEENVGDGVRMNGRLPLGLVGLSKQQILVAVLLAVFLFVIIIPEGINI